MRSPRRTFGPPRDDKFHFLFILFFLLFTPLSASITNGTPGERAAAIDAAVKKSAQDKKTFGALRSTLNDNNAPVNVRERAAWALGELEAKEAVPDLVKAAKHKGLLIRSAAMEALVRIRTPAALPIVIDIAKNDPIFPLRQRATLALGLLRSPKAIQPVVDLASDEREEIRGAAALAMGALQSKTSDFSEALKEMIGREPPYVQERARRALDAAQLNNAAMRKHLTAEDADIRLFAGFYFRFHGASADLAAVEKAQNVEAVDDVRYQMEVAVRSIKKRRAAVAAKAAAAKKNGSSAASKSGKPKEGPHE